MHIFPQITYNLQNFKKRLNIFRLRHAPPNYNKFHFGNKFKLSRGRGKNMNFKFNIDPCLNIFPFHQNLKLLPFNLALVFHGPPPLYPKYVYDQELPDSRFSGVGMSEGGSNRQCHFRKLYVLKYDHAIMPKW